MRGCRAVGGNVDMRRWLWTQVHATKVVTELKELHNFLVKRFADMRKLLASLDVIPQEEVADRADGPAAAPGLAAVPAMPPVPPQ